MWSLVHLGWILDSEVKCIHVWQTMKALHRLQISLHQITVTNKLWYLNGFPNCHFWWLKKILTVSLHGLLTVWGLKCFTTVFDLVLRKARIDGQVPRKARIDGQILILKRWIPGQGCLVMMLTWYKSLLSCLFKAWLWCVAWLFHVAQLWALFIVLFQQNNESN